MHTWIERRRREPEGLRSSPAVNRAPETSCHMAPASAFSETLETGPPSLPEALEGGRGGVKLLENRNPLGGKPEA